MLTFNISCVIHCRNVTQIRTFFNKKQAPLLKRVRGNVSSSYEGYILIDISNIN